MSDRSLSELEEFFLALSDGTRLRLLSLMRESEVSVGYLAEKLKTSQPKISRHLAYLRAAGLVETRRDGKWIYYHIAELSDRFPAQSLDDALEWVGNLTGQRSIIKRRPETDFIQEPLVVELTESISEEIYSNDIEVYLL